MGARKEVRVDLTKFDAERPILIAGPTASGKSALAIALSRRTGGTIVNADALQVYSAWRVLTARPSTADEQAAPHALYGHVRSETAYSAGAWLRDITPYLSAHPAPIIVGGTGLNFAALTEGFAEIPAIPNSIRSTANQMPLNDMVAALDPTTISRLDLANRARVQRAWEVQQATGKPLSVWQDDTPPPVLPLKDAQPIVVDAPKEWLTPRIEMRFGMMIEAGALDEVRQNQFDFDPTRPCDKAIGAPELMAHLNGDMTLDAAVDRSVIATRQYAKRQRTWFRARMQGWQVVSGSDLATLV
jgi:tRNA dimethylallyltransferase